jgi:hypothetical protein
MAFAIILSITIIFGIVNAVGALISVATGDTFFHNSRDNKDNIDFDEDFTGVKSIDINISTGSFQIKNGDTVPLGKHAVEDNKIVGAGAGHFDSCFAVLGGVDHKAVSVQKMG